MIHLSRFQAVRYRGISGLELDDIRRVNLITGPNGVGKTSLLEAIWLLGGRFAPTLPWNIHVQRSSRVGLDPIAALGDGGVELRGTEQGADCQWKAAFHRTRIVGAEEGGPESGANGSAPPSRPDVPVAQSPPPPAGQLRVWMNGREVAGDEVVVVSGSPVAIPGITPPPGRPGAIIHMPLSLLDTEKEAIQRFSALVQRGGKRALRDRLQLVHPRLQDVEVVTNPDGSPFILATTGEDDRLPLQALGGGMHRLFRLFVSLGEVSHGLLLVDEIENGLHHAVLRQLWRRLRDAVEEFDVQFFATTHSDECLRAALEAFGERPEDIAVHGLYLAPDGGATRAATFAGGTLEGARDLDLELR